MHGSFEVRNQKLMDMRHLRLLGAFASQALHLTRMPEIQVFYHFHIIHNVRLRQVILLEKPSAHPVHRGLNLFCYMVLHLLFTRWDVAGSSMLCGILLQRAGIPPPC